MCHLNDSELKKQKFCTCTGVQWTEQDNGRLCPVCKGVVQVKDTVEITENHVAIIFLILLFLLIILFIGEPDLHDKIVLLLAKWL